MPDLSVARLEYCAIHYIGSKSQDENVIYSRNLTLLSNETLKNLLTDYFLSSFKEDDIQRFVHHTALEKNETYNLVKQLFADPDSLLLRSVEIATHLYDISESPNIHGGDFCVAYFEDCFLDGFTSPAIGLFKIESHDKYLHFDEMDGSIQAGFDTGIHMSKPDKACLIFDQNEEAGYKVLAFERGKNGDIQYWREKFLGIGPVNDDYHFTSHMLKVTRDFVTREMPTVFETEKSDSIHLLNKSLDYFKNNETFDRSEFANSVFEDQKVAETFVNYDDQYRKFNDIPESESFEIDNRAVRKQARIYKSVLKLDRNFHIYIHGNKELIEKGTEPDGRKFYKIYFSEES